MARILIMNEDPDICEGCRVVLTSSGFEVRCIEDTSTGLATVREFEPDLMILDDWAEQSHDGMRMAGVFRRAGFTKPILLLTELGHMASFVYARGGVRLPVDAIQEKPVEPKRLLSVVAGLLVEKPVRPRRRQGGQRLGRADAK